MKRAAFALLGAMTAGAAVAQTLLDEIAAADRRDDAAVAAICTADELAAWQAAWRNAWLDGLGGLPERTPLNAQEGPVTKCDGFTLQNVLFESMPGVYVVGHLALPDAPRFKPPYPAVLTPMGHSDSGILATRYAAHLAMMARAGFAAFTWDPVSQGERRQSAPKYAYTDNCSTEHTRLGFRGWLVGWNFARFRLWDGIRALDWLETRRDVDCAKVGVCGTSGGGTMSAYLQALDPRIKVAFPNCYVSSVRAVFGERGCHDAEQFFWNQLNVGVNHAAMLAMGAGRVSFATGSRWKDYFPHTGAVATFAVHSNLCTRCRLSVAGCQLPAASISTVHTKQPATSNQQPAPLPPWHFHCDGPHGLSLPTRQAQVDWMAHCILGGPAPKPLADYWALSTGDHAGANDPCERVALPFPEQAAFFTLTHSVRDLPGFRSVYDILAERARALAKARPPKTREQLREAVRRRANIRPLAELCGDSWSSSSRADGFPHLRASNNPTIQQSNNSTLLPFDHPKFNWWYLKGVYGYRRENEAATLATLGRSVVGRDAERIIMKAVAEIRRKFPDVTNSQLSTLNPQLSTPLKAAGWDCIAAAHAYAAEPQLFSSVEFDNMPPSWTDMVTNPDPKDDSFAVAVWGALEEYDWTDLVRVEKGETFR